MTDLTLEDCYRVSEDGATFALLVDASYGKHPLMPPISKATVGTLLELARKYDVEDLSSDCDRFLSYVDFTPKTHSHWHCLAAKYNCANALERFRQYVKEHFDELQR